MMHVKAPEKIPMIDQGIYYGVCCWLIYLGKQYSLIDRDYTDRMLIYWQLPGEHVIVGDRELPRRVFREFTVSLSASSHLRRTLEAWRGKPYTGEEAQDVNLSKLLGVGAQVQIMHKPKKTGELKAVVENVLPLPRGVQLPPVETLIFDLDDPATYPAFSQLPNWIQKRISQAQGFADTGLVVGSDDALPPLQPMAGPGGSSAYAPQYQAAAQQPPMTAPGPSSPYAPQYQAPVQQPPMAAPESSGAYAPQYHAPAQQPPMAASESSSAYTPQYQAPAQQPPMAAPESSSAYTPQYQASVQQPPAAAAQLPQQQVTATIIPPMMAPAYAPAGVPAGLGVDEEEPEDLPF